MLDLFPGAPESPIQCRLRVVTFAADNPPKYEALSYCWGKDHNTKVIDLVGGPLISVTPNLELALWHLRLSYRVRTLWIDAICINQKNARERDSQIEIMSRIYRDAKRVVVWLGEASDTTEQAVLLLVKLSDAIEIFGENSQSRSVWDWPELKEFLGVKVGVLEYHRSGPVKALNDFMRLPWFGRLWIVQEVTSAKHIRIRCGKFHIPWRKLYAGLRFAAKCNIALNPHDTPAYISWSPFILRLETKGNIGLLYLLQEYRYALCTYPNDKIFALLGLSQLTHLSSLRLLQEEYSSINISPDSDMPVEELYKLLAYKLIKANGNLDILSVLGLYPTETTSPSRTETALPSWVPDWRPSIAVLPLLDYTRSGRAPKLYDASRESTASPELTGNTLVLNGFVYDTIIYISNEYELLRDDVLELGDSSPTLRGFRNIWIFMGPFFTWFFSFCRLWAQYDYIALRNGTGTRQELLDTYWQTIVCASKSEISTNPEIFGQNMNDQKYVELIKKWFRGRFFTRTAFRLGLSSPSLHIFPFCILLDFALMALLSLSCSLGTIYQPPPFVKIPGRKLARTQKSHLALVVAGAREGDSIGIFQGGKTPLIIRATGSGTWHILGDAYVHGIMKGEVWDELKCEEIQFD